MIVTAVALVVLLFLAAIGIVAALGVKEPPAPPPGS